MCAKAEAVKKVRRWLRDMSEVGKENRSVNSGFGVVRSPLGVLLGEEVVLGDDWDGSYCGSRRKFKVTRILLEQKYAVLESEFAVERVSLEGLVRAVERASFLNSHNVKSVAPAFNRLTEAITEARASKSTLGDCLASLDDDADKVMNYKRPESDFGSSSSSSGLITSVSETLMDMPNLHRLKKDVLSESNAQIREVQGLFLGKERHLVSSRFRMAANAIRFDDQSQPGKRRKTNMTYSSRDVEDPAMVILEEMIEIHDSGRSTNSVLQSCIEDLRLHQAHRKEVQALDIRGLKNPREFRKAKEKIEEFGRALLLNDCGILPNSMSSDEIRCAELSCRLLYTVENNEEKRRQDLEGSRLRDDYLRSNIPFYTKQCLEWAHLHVKTNPLDPISKKLSSLCNMVARPEVLKHEVAVLVYNYFLEVSTNL